MRITGGEWRSRVLVVPPDQTITRPTMDQTRQAVFNILNSASWALQENGQPLVFRGTILDLFAGSGAYGFEALSRGASQVTFVDRDAKSIEAIRKNVEALKCTDQAKIIRSDASMIAASQTGAVSVCFMDPPYADESWPDVIRALQHRSWIDDKTLVVVETNSKTSREALVLAESVLDVHDQRTYGKSLVIFGQVKP